MNSHTCRENIYFLHGLPAASHVCDLAPVTLDDVTLFEGPFCNTGTYGEQRTLAENLIAFAWLEDMNLYSQRILVFHIYILCLIPTPTDQTQRLDKTIKFKTTLNK